MFVTHQQCSSKGRAGYTFPGHGKRRKEAEVAVKATGNGREKDAAKTRKESRVEMT